MEKKGDGNKLKPGMIFTVEPMINEGGMKQKLSMMVGQRLQKIKNYQHNLNTLLV